MEAYKALKDKPYTLLTEHEFAAIAPAILSKAQQYGGWHIVIRGAVHRRRGALAALRRVEIIEAWRQAIQKKHGEDTAAKLFALCEKRGRGLAHTRAKRLAKLAYAKLR